MLFIHPSKDWSPCPVPGHSSDESPRFSTSLRCTAGFPHSLCTICKLMKQNMSCTRFHKVLTPHLALRHFRLYSSLCHCVCREISVPEVIILSKPWWLQPRYPRVEKGHQQSSQESSGGGKLCAQPVARSWSWFVPSLGLDQLFSQGVSISTTQKWRIDSVWSLHAKF